jgi:hypothetical protein
MPGDNPNGHATGTAPPWKLVEEIKALSVADTWDRARPEWFLDHVYFADAGRCLCGHAPIVEHCVIVNRVNGNRAVVGSVCVTKFLDLPADKHFASLRRVTRDPVRTLNAKTVEFAHAQGCINDWERDFYLDTIRRYPDGYGRAWLSPKQQDCRVRINQKVLAHFRARDGGRADA